MIAKLQSHLLEHQQRRKIEKHNVYWLLAKLSFYYRLRIPTYSGM
jgi:hypothetical protein